MITAIHRRGNPLSKGLATRTNPRKSKVNMIFRKTEGFVLIFEPSHCKLDIINDVLHWIHVVNKYILDYLKFVFNLAITADI